MRARTWVGLGLGFGAFSALACTSASDHPTPSSEAPGGSGAGGNGAGGNGAGGTTAAVGFGGTGA
jgi:hypothetical protein